MFHTAASRPRGKALAVDWIYNVILIDLQGRSSSARSGCDVISDGVRVARTPRKIPAEIAFRPCAPTRLFFTRAYRAAYIYRMKICVYAICKNESAFAERWVKSMSEADEITVLDTGSNDKSAEKLAALGARVRTKIVDPWRFDVARNLSLADVSEDADVCVCTDLDEVFEPGWRKKIETVWRNGVTRGRYRYVWSHDGEAAGVEFLADKIHARRGYEWVNPVHEVLKPTGKEVWAAIDGLTLHHYPNPKKSRAAYLPLLELAVKEDPSNDRNSHYLGREYYFRGAYDKAIAELERHLSLPTAVWREERSASMRYIAASYRSLGKFDNAEKWYLRACLESPESREPSFDYARMLYSLGNYAGAVFWLNKTLSVTVRSLSYISSPEAWGAEPYDLLALSLFALGSYDEAAKYGRRALELSPSDERLKSNLYFYEEKTKK